MSLSPDEAATYASKIDRILSKSDLNTISAKRIRKELQDGLVHDISHQKAAINSLIAKRFDAFAADKGVVQPSSPPQQHPAPTTNGVSFAKHNGAEATSSAESHSFKQSDESDDLSDVNEDGPPKKKAKRAPMDDDAAFAARLQAEENNRARPTRGGVVTKKRQVVKKTKSPKKKSSSKVKAADDSDLDSGSDNDKPKKRTGAFHKPQHLSPPLAQLLGESILSRPRTVKGIWDYVKAKQLQNPSDKRQIICDDALRAVFKKESVNMFSMNKILSTQLTPVDEST